MNNLFRSVIFLLAICFSFTAFAQPSLESLAQSAKWQALLHYQTQGLMHSFYSEVDDDKFFLSANGKYDPLEELRATINEFKQNAKADESAQCRFPARLHWLQTQLPEENWAKVSCPKFDEWYGNVQGTELFLIFPASYMNSPSSMFGHTLLRLDGKQGHKLLTSAINFAAFTDPNDDELTFTIKGLVGGYPGYVSLVPYYEKVNEYNHIESRDIWEYKLNLNYEQIQMFTRHIWELNEIRFDYYFLDENCSYRLMTLLNVIDPEWKLADDFNYRTIPTDTLRVLESRDLVSDINFRPSKTTKIEQQRLQLSQTLRETARDLADAPNTVALDNRFTGLSDVEKTQVLDLAYEYNRYLHVKQKEKDPTLLKRSLKLLSLRSKVDIQGSGFDDIVRPSIRDEEGHETLRTTLGAMDGFGVFGFRPNYHDWLDNLPGYRKGAQIEMGDTQVRFNENHLQLNYFDLITVQTLVPRNRFNHSISWQVNAGYERWLHDDKGHNYVTLGGGVGYEMGPGVVYGFAQGQVAYGKRYQDRWRLGLGSEVGYLIQQSSYTALLTAEYLKNAFQAGESIRYGVGLTKSLSRDQQIRLQWNQDEYGDESEDALRISYVIYH